MPKKVLLILAVLLNLNLNAASPVAAQGPLNFEDYIPPLVDYHLSNGLRVILAEDHSAPVVAVDIWYRVGGANDPPDRSGFAHLFEHMMFEGSDHIGNNEYFALLQAIGGQGNAYTANDKTAFWEVAPANELPRLLWMESDRMASLAVNEANFETQRQVVIEEYGQRVANRPYGLTDLRAETLPFQGYGPYERSVIGSVEDLQAATLAEARDFFDRYYKPNNATLVIVGDIDVALTQALVQAYFDDIPAGEPVVPILAQYPLPDAFPVLATDSNGCQLGYAETMIDPQVELPRFTAEVVGPPRSSADYYALRLLVDILGSGQSSRFEQHIVRQGLAASASINLDDYLGASVLAMTIIPNAGDSIEPASDLIRAEFNDVIANGVTAEELARVKTRLKIRTITAFRGSALETAEWLQDAVLTAGDPTSTAERLARYDAVTVEDVRQAAQTYFCDRPLNTLITLPEGEAVVSEYPGLLVQPQEVEAPQETGPDVVDLDDIAARLADLPDGVVRRTAAPASLPVAASTLPPFETFSLANGLDVIFVEQHEVPKVRLQLYVGGSNPAAPADKQGVATLMADLLTKGTPIQTAEQIAATVESVGGSINTQASLETVFMAVEVPLTDTRLAFCLLAHLARFSNFPQAEFDLVQGRTLTFLQQAEVNPDALANRQFGRIVFGSHPYGFATTTATVQNLTRQDIVDFYRTYFKANNALLVIVGDITATEAHALVEQTFAHWAEGDVPNYLDYPSAETGDTSVIYVVDRPGSEQATIHLGNLAIDARSPDRYALTVANAILGGGASSRLFVNLREEKGYTYGVSSRFAQPNDIGSFRVISAVNQANAADAMREILKELERIRTESVSAQELQDAKGRLIGSFALAIEDPADFAGQLAGRRLSGIPLEELNTYLPTLAQVTADEVQAAAAKYIDSTQPLIVVVGDATTLKPQLTELGPVVVVDKDGQVIEE